MTCPNCKVRLIGTRRKLVRGVEERYVCTCGYKHIAYLPRREIND